MNVRIQTATQINRKPEAGMELQYFTVPEDLKHRIKTFLYVPCFSLYGVYDDKVAEAIACNVARKVYEVFGNTEQAGAMQKEIDAALQTMGV